MLKIKNRFRGFLPVVVDVETGGFDTIKNSLLELGAYFVDYNHDDKLVLVDKYHKNITPHTDTEIDPDSLKITGIIPNHPMRFAINEKKALQDFFIMIKEHLKKTGCSRAVLVGHNPTFDLHFIHSACIRSGIKKQNTPLHLFTTFDTASLSALIYGETVLAKSVKKAGIEFNENEAHSALYDARKTAELFCTIINNYNLEF